MHIATAVIDPVLFPCPLCGVKMVNLDSDMLEGVAATHSVCVSCNLHQYTLHESTSGRPPEAEQPFLNRINALDQVRP